MPRFIRSACLTDYVSIARSFGLDPYRLLREADLDRSCLGDPEIKIPVGAVCRLLENSAHAARAEDFGLRMSEPRRLSGLGPLALAMRDAGTLREALQSASRYVCLHTDSLHLSLKEMDNLAMLEIEPLTDGSTPSRQSTELAVGVFHRAVRELLGNSPNSSCLVSAHRPEEYVETSPGIWPSGRIWALGDQLTVRSSRSRRALAPGRSRHGAACQAIPRSDARACSRHGERAGPPTSVRATLDRPLCRRAGSEQPRYGSPNSSSPSRALWRDFLVDCR